jgi:molecular chaperone GrpE
MDDKNKHATPDDNEPAAPATPPAEAEVPAADPRDTEIAALKERLLRLQADFDNYRKRAARDREDQARRACEHILEDLLPVLDHFDLGLKAAQKHHVKHAVIDGLGNVLKQFEQVLEKAGVVPIETLGKVFDPHLHECVAHLPSEEHPEHVIIQETRRGYRLGTFLLRASQVIASTGPAKTGAPAAPPPDKKTEPSE